MLWSGRQIAKLGFAYSDLKFTLSEKKKSQENWLNTNNY